MDHIGNLAGKEGKNTSMLAVPGAATIKACSIIINSFLHYDAFLKRMDKRAKPITDDLFRNITSSYGIAMTGAMQSDGEGAANIDEVKPEAVALAKAHGMVHHLKHTHSSDIGS